MRIMDVIEKVPPKFSSGMIKMVEKIPNKITFLVSYLQCDYYEFYIEPNKRQMYRRYRAFSIISKWNLFQTHTFYISIGYQLLGLFSFSFSFWRKWLSFYVQKIRQLKGSHFVSLKIKHFPSYLFQFVR